MSQIITNEWLIHQYLLEGKSYREMAEITGTSYNYIRDKCIKAGIRPRGYRESQINAVKTKRHKSPTKGKSRSDEVKEKIANTLMDWGVTPEGFAQKSAQSKKWWDALPPEKKEEFIQNGQKVKSKAVIYGSQMQIGIIKYLQKKTKYLILMNKEEKIKNTLISFDVFLPERQIAIQVNGKVFWSPIYGEKNFKEVQDTMVKENELVFGSGVVLIRVKQASSFSNGRCRLVCNKILNILKESTPKGYYEISDEV